MSDKNNLQPRSIILNFVFIFIFTMLLINNVSSFYLNHFKFDFNAIMLLLDLCLIIYYVKDLIVKQNHNKEFNKFKH